MAINDSRGKDTLLGTVLVTGGCGFIGSFIVEAFVQDANCSSIVVASRNPNKFRVPQATYIACDLSKQVELDSLLERVRPRVIIHTISPGPYAPLDEQYRISYLITKRLLEAAKRQSSVRAFIWTSSVNALCLDATKNSRPYNEDEMHVLDLHSKGVSPYSKVKGATETLVLATNTDAATTDLSKNANWSGKLLTTSLRITCLYGPRDKLTMLELLNTKDTVATRIQIGNNVLVHSWVYVESAAHAHVLAAKAMLDGQHIRSDMRVDGEAFWIGDPEPIHFWDVPRMVWKEAGDDFSTRPEDQQKYIVIPFWFIIAVAITGEWVFWFLTLGIKTPKMTRHHFEYMSRGCWPSLEKARTRLGYEPICNTKEGIRRTVKWFKNNEGWGKMD